MGFALILASILAIIFAIHYLLFSTCVGKCIIGCSCCKEGCSSGCNCSCNKNTEALANRVSPDVIPMPIHSYYRQFSRMDGNLVIGYHYSESCSYCQQFTPIWSKLKATFKNQPKITVIENNESTKKTPGIYTVPTIIRYWHGRAEKYDGIREYHHIYEWALNPLKKIY